MKYLLGVDFGGSSSKATLLREDGVVAATASREYPTYYPENGWAEQDAEDSYNAACANIRELLEKTGVAPEDVAALALDAATHTAVLLGEDDRPVRRAIYWTDTRASAEAAQLKREMGPALMEECYNSVSSLWTLPQLMWLKKHEPETLRKTRKVLAVKDYVRYRMTGDYVTDTIEAMGFLLLDARKNQWSETLCAMAGLDVRLMPPIVEPTTHLSPLTAQAQADTGLTAKTAVIAGATDTVMEVFASGSIAVGQSTIKLATAGRICPITDRAYVHPLLVTYRHLVPGLWYPGTATKQCAASFRWYRDTFGAFETARESSLGLDAYAQMDAAAAEVPAGSDNLFFHPYLQGEITPYLDNDLRGSFTGMSSFHTKAHFNRAVLEGVAYSLKECYHVLQDMGIAMNSASIIGGGAKSALWRQIVSDMLGIELKKMERDDSSLGSAMLGGIAYGAFDGYEDCVARCTKVAFLVQPNEKNHAVYEKGFQTYRAIHDALAPVYHALCK